jgi:hypothetical protein
MAVNNPDFKVKHGLRVGGTSTLAGGLSCLENADFNKDLTVKGNLVVDGDTVTLNTSAIQVEDPLLSLGTGNVTNTLDIGFYGQYNDGSTKFAGLFRDATDGIFKLFANQTTNPDTGNISTTGTISKGVLSANLQGRADTATALANQLTIAFKTSSAIGGSVTFLGNENSVTFDADIEDLSITSAMIGAEQVTAGKIGDNAVGPNELSAGAVDTSSKIGALVVEESNIAGSAVTNSKIGTNAVDTAEIKADAVTTVKIADNQITNDKMADDSIGNAEIIDGAIEAPKLANDSIFTAAIQDLAVIRAHIAADAVDGTKIADDAIGNEHMENNSVNTSEIYDAAITTVKIADSTGVTDGITTAKIATSAVTHDKLGANVVQQDNIATDAISTETIQDDAATNAKILNDYITINSVRCDLGADITVEGLSAVIDTPSIDLHIAGVAGNAILSADVVIADDTLEVAFGGGLSGLRIKALGIEASHLADDSVITRTILDGNVTNSKLANGAVSDIKIALDHGQFITLSGNCLSSTNDAFDNTVANNYRAVNYFVQGNVGGDYQCSYVTVLHNGSDVWLMEHGMVHTTVDTFLVFDAHLSGGNVGLEVRHNHSSGDATCALRAVKQAIKSGQA